MPKYKVEYNSNNSGGFWWLKDKDWKNLEKAGWTVKWEDKPFLGALATKCFKVFEARTEDSAENKAIADWEDITEKNAYDTGCECCGCPHNFYANIENES